MTDWQSRLRAILEGGACQIFWSVMSRPGVKGSRRFKIRVARVEIRDPSIVRLRDMVGRINSGPCAGHPPGRLKLASVEIRNKAGLPGPLTIAEFHACDAEVPSWNHVIGWDGEWRELPLHLMGDFDRLGSDA